MIETYKADSHLKGWESGIAVIKDSDLIVAVDPRAYSTALYIDKKVDMEFSVLFKGTWYRSVFIVSPDYYIPEQEVSSASVDYKEDLSIKRQEGFNVILHKHPRSITSFSTADYDSINQNFGCSLLLADKKITEATLLIKVNNDSRLVFTIPQERILIIPMTPDTNAEMDELITNKIKEKKYTFGSIETYGYKGYNEYRDIYAKDESLSALYGSTNTTKTKLIDRIKKVISNDTEVR